MGQLKAFVLWVIKVTIALVLTVVVLGVLGWGGYAIWDSMEKAKHAPLAQPKTWPPIKVEALSNTQLTLMTMWRDGRLYYQFKVLGYPRSISAAREKKLRSSSLSPQFTISFLDENRFKLFEHAVPLDKMAMMADADGRGAGLDANDDTHMNPDVYSRSVSWDITWNFGETADASDIPPPSAKPGSAAPRPQSKARWQNVSNWRTLRRGMSKDEVKQALGEPTKINEMSVITFWYYGYPVGGRVQFDSRKGTVEAWSEP